MSRILYISPVRVEDSVFEEGIDTVARPGNTIDVVGFARGSRHLEYHYYEALTTPDIVHSVIAAEAQGYDAAVIGCFYDLALHESREMAQRIVVTAPCESAILLAATLGDSFGIIVGRRKWIPQMRANVHAYGLGDRLTGFETLEFGVLDYHRDEAETLRRFLAAGRRAIDKGAEVIVLGCTASAGFYRQLQAELGVPVIDSAIAAVKAAEQQVELRDSFGWGVSKIGGYERPPASELDGWNLRADYAPTDVTTLWKRQRPS